MNARRPKPSALKERTSIRPSLGLSRLFASANEAVENEPSPPLALVPEGEDRTLNLDDPRLREATVERVRVQKEEQEYGTAVRVPNRAKAAAKPILDLDVTKTMRIQPSPSGATSTTSTTKTDTKSEVPHRTSVSKLQQASEKKSESRTKRLALVCLIPAIALLGYALVMPSSNSHAPATPKSALSNAEIQDRLKYYQTTLGQRLNRQRIGVEIENYRQAPALSGSDRKVKPPSMLDGVPLQGEANNFQRPKDLNADPTYSEARTAYGLQEEQERRRFEQQAERAWVQEFIDNAHKDGYNVQIDEFGRVTAKKMSADELPPPEATTDSNYGSAGGAQ